ncbi:hypothetical protein, partial [Mucilaginibacter polytrichastri]|uniref:hypothetical protein n=1 Tax=Mucilaginibacter polytrichastri TaxID=1302689 RepID=UPI001C0C2216
IRLPVLWVAETSSAWRAERGTLLPLATATFLYLPEFSDFRTSRLPQKTYLYARYEQKHRRTI